MDRKFWDYYLPEVEATFEGRRFTHMQGVRGVEFARIHRMTDSNSGVGALLLAAHLGAKRIVMLGYDCQKTGGRAHWHEDHPTKPFGRHPKGFGNAGSLPKWPGQFSRAAQHLRGLEIVNATRETALAMFRRVGLEDALA